MRYIVTFDLIQGANYTEAYQRLIALGFTTQATTATGSTFLLPNTTVAGFSSLTVEGLRQALKRALGTSLKRLLIAPLAGEYFAEQTAA